MRQVQQIQYILSYFHSFFGAGYLCILKSFLMISTTKYESFLATWKVFMKNDTFQKATLKRGCTINFDGQDSIQPFSFMVNYRKHFIR